MADFTLSGVFPRSSIVDAASSGGVAVTPSASANTKGSFVELVASLGHNVCGVLLQITNPNTADVLVDIAVGAAASEIVVLQDLIVSTTGTGNVKKILSAYIPLSLPSGARLSARCQNGAVSGVAVTVAVLCMTTTFEGQSGLAKAVTYGADTTDSGGLVVDPGAVANTKGSWVQLSASTGQDINWLLIMLGNKANNGRTVASWLLDISVGAAASETVLIPDILLRASGTLGGVDPQVLSFPVSLPSGSRLAVRAACSTTDATDRLFDIILLGVG